jgi:chemotaxis protein methyltransferase CheR
MKDALLSIQLFTLLGGLLEERTGVAYGVSAIETFSAKVGGRLAASGFESALDYYYYLRYDAASVNEFDALVDELVVNESYFFREPDQLMSLRDDVILPLVERGERPRVWCAAASAGEEPLSVAMLLAEAGVLSHVDIFASDISTRALARAKSGDHPLSALRACPPALQERYIGLVGGRVVVAPEIRAKIEWRRHNLLDASAATTFGTFDGILCRNVFIYFGDDTVRRVVGTLSGALRASGRLFVGATESLFRFGMLLRSEEKNGAFSYLRMDE